MPTSPVLKMSSTVVSDPSNVKVSSHARHRFRHPTILLLLVVLIVGGGLWGILWWQERPIRIASGHLDRGDLKAAAQILATFLREHPDHEKALALKARILVE